MVIPTNSVPPDVLGLTMSKRNCIFMMFILQELLADAS